MIRTYDNPATIAAETAECPTCQGNGLVHVQRRYGRAADEPYVTETCWACSGTGVVAADAVVFLHDLRAGVLGRRAVHPSARGPVPGSPEPVRGVHRRQGRPMSTGHEHYREAQQLLAKSQTVSMDDGYAQLVVAQAQVHATLALAAATALQTAGVPVDGLTAAGWRQEICVSTLKDDPGVAS